MGVDQRLDVRVDHGGDGRDDQLVVGIDGGASKTDVAVVTMSGELVGRERGPGCCPHFTGVEESARIVDELVTAATRGGSVVHAAACVSGLDLPSEVDDYRRLLARFRWAQQGLVVENDLFALLRTSSESRNAVAVVCGTGTNAVGAHESGQRVRFYSLGPLSGDWGGGQGIGQEALWHAARAVDGRGPATTLTATIADQYGMPVTELIERIHLGKISELTLSHLAPAVFAASDAGDRVAQQLVDRQGDEVIAYVRACATKLQFSGDVDVVLGGGILHARNPRMHGRIAAAITEFLPGAQLVTPQQAPVVGATLLALEAAGASPAVVADASGNLG